MPAALAITLLLWLAGPPARAHVDALSRPDSYGRAVRLIREELEGITRSRASGDLKDVGDRAGRLARLAAQATPLAESLAVAGALSDTSVAAILEASGELSAGSGALAIAAVEQDTAAVASAAERCARAHQELRVRVLEQFVCPMHCEPGKIYLKPGTCPVCGMDLQLVTDDRYQVVVTPARAPIRAGKRTTLRFRILDPAGFAARLQVVHEKLLHLMVVSEDLSWFEHVHPVIEGDSAFTLPITFPAGGTYTLYHDFTPERVGLQVVPVELTVEGKRPKPIPLVVDDSTTKTVDGLEVKLRHTALAIDVDCAMSFTLSRQGKPVTDLQPFLGASGHLVMISLDRAAYVHSHPLDASSGPRIQFNMTFERTGLYRAWGQFQRKGKVITVPFTVEVSIDGHRHIGTAATPGVAR